jgi:hypothetical protein
MPIFESESGFLTLSDGRYRQVIFRFRWPFFYVLWKKGNNKIEVPIRIDELFRLLLSK